MKKERMNSMESKKEYECFMKGCAYRDSVSDAGNHVENSCRCVGCPSRMHESGEVPPSIRYFFERRNDEIWKSMVYKDADMCATIGKFLKEMGMEETGGKIVESAQYIRDRANERFDIQNLIRECGFESLEELVWAYNQKGNESEGAFLDGANEALSLVCREIGICPDHGELVGVKSVEEKSLYVAHAIKEVLSAKTKHALDEEMRNRLHDYKAGINEVISALYRDFGIEYREEDLFCDGEDPAKKAVQVAGAIREKLGVGGGGKDAD